jgi:radical SAM superfamily enzyme YgiQ (UPF0313 family)
MGFEIIAYCILGLPGERIETMMASLKFLHLLPVKVGPSIFYPVPGTRVYDDCLEKGLIRAEDTELFRLTAAYVETDDFKRKDLMTLFYLSRILNLFKERAAGSAKPGAAQALDEFLSTRRIFHYFKTGRQEAAYSREVVELFFEKFGALLKSRGSRNSV